MVTFDSGLLFPFNSTDLLPAGQDNLRNLAASLQENPETEVLIVGHTDARGADSYNQGLSERRAATAASILSANGVPRDRIDALARRQAAADRMMASLSPEQRGAAEIQHRDLIEVVRLLAHDAVPAGHAHGDQGRQDANLDQAAVRRKRVKDRHAAPPRRRAG